MRTLSLCIPTWERTKMTLESFAKVYNDPRIDEIVIVDDCSSIECFKELEKGTSQMGKVKLFRNSFNYDCYRNKHQAVQLTTNEFIILLDSDNVIDTDYLDRIFEIEKWDEETIYTPSFAKPHFDFRQYEGLELTKENIFLWINKPNVEVMLNAANYFVNRLFYLSVWDGSVDPVTSDSIYQCYSWLKKGLKIKVVKGLEYEHRIHNQSHYKLNNAKTPVNFHKMILNKLNNM